MRYNSQSSCFACYTTGQAAVQLYKKQEAAPSTDPFVSPATKEVNYKFLPTANLNETLSFTAGNLTGGLTISVASATEGGTAVISVDKNTVEQTATTFDLTLTTTDLAEGEYSDIITIKMGETTLSTVTVNLKVELNYPYKKVTTTEEVTAGLYLIVNEEKSHAAGVISGTYLTAASVSISGTEDSEKTIETKGDAVEFELEKNGDDWTIKSSEGYLKTTQNKSNNLAYTNKADEATSWPITVSGNATIGVKNTYGTLEYNYNNGSNPRFTNYTGSQTAIQLYKKQLPTCEKVTNVQETVGTTSLKLDWTASTSEPSSYKVSIKQGETEVVKDEVVTGTTYTKTGLSENTAYTYSIVSVCSETLSSGAVTGTVTTHAANVKALSVMLSGNQANGNYTGAITFTFNPTNCTLGSDAKVSYMITGNKEGGYSKDGLTDQETLVVNDFESDSYEALFELVNMDGTSLSPKVEVEKTFTVKLPKVAAPTFTPAAQTAAFTSAQTITLASATEDASVYYAIGDAEFAAYTAGIELSATGTYVIKAYAAKAGMDNSDTLTKTYKIQLPETVANLKAVYGKVNNDVVKVSGQMVVTHKDTAYNCRVWVQDINKENGASIMLYGVPAAEYTLLKVGDVLENVVGTVTIYNGLYELKPTEKVEAKEHGHAVYVDTLTADYINKNIATVQNALVCVENVTFASTGNFAKTTKYTLQQGAKELNFYTTLTNADYIGKAIPTGRLNIVGILGYNNGANKEGTYIVARNLADMVTAPCLVPTDITVEAHETEADLDWDGLAENYSVRYGKAEDMTGATEVEANTSHLHLANLDAATTYHYQIKSVCGTDGYESEWTVVKSFTTMEAGKPSIRMTSPLNEPKFTDSVLVTFTVKNVTLKASDTSARIVFSDGFTYVTTDTAYKRALPSGNYSVRVELIQNKDTLTPNVRTQSRKFSVDLPNVAAPEFTPAAGRYADSVEVTLACATEGASIFYAQGEGEYVAYTTGEKIVLKETTDLKAFACKERMDTSAVVPARYVITKTIGVEGDLVFEETFAKVANGTAQITASLDDNTTLPGWSGDFVYQHTGGSLVRLGKSDGLGWLETPAIDLSENNGKFMVVFYAQAWKNDKDTIRVVVGDQSVIIPELVNDKETNQARITDMTRYVLTFENGTAETKIKFEALTAKPNNRFFLDSIQVYQVLPNVPTIFAQATCAMSTVQGTPVSSEITVKGKLLDNDVTVTCTEGNFTVSPASLDKDEVMGENGAKFTVTFNGNKVADTAEITLTSGELSKTIHVTATATPVVEVENIAALRAGEQNTLYRIKGQVVITAMDTYRNYKWIQDATGAILIDDATKLVTNTYEVGDGITGVYGKLGQYGGQLQLIMTGNLPEATSHDNTVEPEVVTVKDLTENIEKYCSRLVRINDLTLEETEGEWKGNADNWAVNAEGDSINVRTFVRNGSYIGEALPEGKFDLIALAGVYNNGVQVSPRVKEDIIGGEVNPCDAPTRLKAVVVDKNATLTWNGAAEQYRVVVTLGEKEICNELVSEETYSLSNLEAGTYAWKVASVCEESEQWAEGEAFEVKPTANEASDELACRLYPNPTTGVFYVEVAEGARMEIFTLGGVVIRSEELVAGRNELRLDRSGIYFVRLTNGNAATVKRVIVR